jgi:hypothetical protein
MPVIIKLAEYNLEFSVKSNEICCFSLHIIRLQAVMLNVYQ